MKSLYFALLIFIARACSMETISPAALALVRQTMARTVNDFDFTSTRIVKKPMVELAEVDWNQKRYLICLRTGHIFNEFPISQRPSAL